MAAHAAGSFIKLGLRRAQAISVVSAAAVVARDGAVVTDARIALGSVAPVVVRAAAAEAYLRGRELSDGDCGGSAPGLGRGIAHRRHPQPARPTVTPWWRHWSPVCCARCATTRRDGWPAHPVMLWGESGGVWPVAGAASRAGTTAHVNGRDVALPGGMTLLDSLREAGFVGVKEGCAEGECGACTVFLDGMAVMACMVPAERASGSEVVTVEGLGDPAHMHPVQQAFVDAGGVQCGYCTPGFVMSAAKLLEERPQPTVAGAQEALTGNFCRCTGYRKILGAVVAAGAAQTGAAQAEAADDG
ncbi:MAG: (2Fe-2S)-binding protein [Caldilineaceae bacterium]